MKELKRRVGILERKVEALERSTLYKPIENEGKNSLSLESVEKIKYLSQLGWSKRKIALRVGSSWSTVDKYIKKNQSKKNK